MMGKNRQLVEEAANRLWTAASTLSPSISARRRR
jgi:hypothetical protein